MSSTPGDRPPAQAGALAATLSPETTLYGIELPRRAPEAPRTGALLVIAGAAADVGTHLPVGDEVVIGRVDVGLVLRGDGRISRRHARVWREGDRWFVEDLGSTNGTALNGRVLERPAPLGDGDKIYVGGSVLKFGVVDETEAAYLDQMARLAGTDPLTGLHAKHRFDSMLDEALRTARLTGAPLWVLMMDMDGLKRINDTHGHRMGAHTVGVVGATLGRLLEGHGEACRFGGDEFCAYVTGADRDEVMALAQRICDAVRDTVFTLDGTEVRASISVGVADRGAYTAPGEVVAAADRALYRAKAAGRDRVSD